MRKWIGRILLILVVGSIGLAVFGYYRAGYFSMPELKDGEYPISFNNGVRGIVVNPSVARPHVMDDLAFFRRLYIANPGRKYLSLAYEVSPWFEDVWSYCDKLSEDETRAILSSLPEDVGRRFAGARLDALCTIDSDGEKIPRGLVFSIPRL